MQIDTEYLKEAEEAGINILLFKRCKPDIPASIELKTETPDDYWGSPDKPPDEDNMDESTSTELFHKSTTPEHVPEPEQPAASSSTSSSPIKPSEALSDCALDTSIETVSELELEHKKTEEPSPNKLPAVPSLQQVLSSIGTRINSSPDVSFDVRTPKRSRTSVKIEPTQCDSAAKYNLRPKKAIRLSSEYRVPVMTHRSKKVKYESNLPKWIPRVEGDFRDTILSEVDVQTYHQFNKDEVVQKVINSTRRSTPSQLVSFVYASKKFVAICWLTTVRIFEYLPEKNIYLEVKRIPKRFIAISPRLITSIHYCTSAALYIAYLWGSEEDEADAKRPYIEVRDISGDLLLDKPFYYEDVVKEIYSDSLYIYVRLVSNVIYLHRKNFFSTMFYRVDFTDERTPIYINTLISSSWNATTYFEGFSKLVMLTATSSQLLVTLFSLFEHRILNRYSFTDCPEFMIVSIDKYRKDFIIHRNIKCPKGGPSEEYLSRVDVGSINNEGHNFAPYINLSFIYYIIQVRLHKDCIYLFGFRETQDGSRFFEVGCFAIKNPDVKPKWVTYLKGVDTSTQILIHSDNIAIINTNQQVTSISTLSREKYECKCCKISFLKKDDKLIHDSSLHKNMFGYKFSLNLIQVPPKKSFRKHSLEPEIFNCREEISQNDE